MYIQCVRTRDSIATAFVAIMILCYTYAYYIAPPLYRISIQRYIIPARMYLRIYLYVYTKTAPAPLPMEAVHRAMLLQEYYNILMMHVNVMYKYNKYNMYT